tara:strand:- start:10536 stop:10754 length:219 start_codon:yes stop_codon:yes gene_type:complete
MKKINEELLNISTRKLLKNVGINSQRIIETKIREAVESGKINSSRSVIVSLQLNIQELNINEEIEGKIEVEF